MIVSGVPLSCLSRLLMLHGLFYFSDNLLSFGDVLGTPITFPIIMNLLLIDLNQFLVCRILAKLIGNGLS